MQALLALGDAQMGGGLTKSLGLPRATARDMAELAAEAGLTVAAATAVGGKPVAGKSLSRLNWTADELVFVLERKSQPSRG